MSNILRENLTFTEEFYYDDFVELHGRKPVSFFELYYELPSLTIYNDFFYWRKKWITPLPKNTHPLTSKHEIQLAKRRAAHRCKALIQVMEAIESERSGQDV